MFVKYDFVVALQANEQFHQEFKPPPEGSMTGVGRQEQVVPVQDMSHDQDQIQQRFFFFFLFQRLCCILLKKIFSIKINLNVFNMLLMIARTD